MKDISSLPYSEAPPAVGSKRLGREGLLGQHSGLGYLGRGAFILQANKNNINNTIACDWMVPVSLKITESHHIFIANLIRKAIILVFKL